ncbi:DUF547 domain-containing protein [Parerythrobacter lacustris]|uniref:DUF547 domain-containing protein n=1 Tax=Parerythrobacter lacustris TaxID=2969984 RepID=A0ABT1XP54_9SPHN|nr:DUF547 domain-containing protein [Parerythrobacter lacustris]MCR2833024.1 DUF547 domain-containing protein [Parerythrobacter lacustris]
MIGRTSCLLAIALASASVCVHPAAAAAQEVATPAAPIAKFVPRPSGAATKFDFEHWDKALRFFVLDQGPSLRQVATQPQASIGTRLTYGQKSQYRLEGNRVTFSMLDKDVIQTLTEYRKDLERIGTEIDIASLPRNEQLAYWINLHNVAVIEQIAQNYPVRWPERLMIDGVKMDDARFLNVAGVALSPKDIRTRIVYPNWTDGRVIYGFFRGEIGGPSIQSGAYTGDNVANLLNFSGNEFVNSLRGVQSRGDALWVSQIYEEARPFYFKNWEADLRAHLDRFAEEPVQKILAETRGVDASLYEADIADLAGGESEPFYSNVESCAAAPGGGLGDCSPVETRIPLNVQRAVQERNAKINELIKERRLGRVTIGDVGPDGKPAEVE